MLRGNLESISGVVDVGIIVIAHFNNPARLEALKFLRKVLKLEIRALIPFSRIVAFVSF